jgi:hypothetical protein
VTVYDILDPEHIDELSGTSALNGQAVTVENNEPRLVTPGFSFGDR